MKIVQTSIAGLLIVEPKRFRDSRGFFSEVWNRQALSRAGLEYDFVQDNQSRSTAVGTIRGLHYQSPPHAQDKLVRAARGVIFDVAVDVRCGSSTFGKWVGVELSDENGLQLLIPKGFLHGFVTRSADAELHYKCSDIYVPACDGAVRFDSPELGIDWGMDISTAILSDKDRDAPLFSQFQSPFNTGNTP